MRPAMPLPAQKSGLGSASLPLPEFQHPSHALLEDAGFNQIKYTHYRDRCLADRQELGAWASRRPRGARAYWPSGGVIRSALVLHRAACLAALESFGDRGFHCPAFQL